MTDSEAIALLRRAAITPGVRANDMALLATAMTLEAPFACGATPATLTGPIGKLTLFEIGACIDVLVQNGIATTDESGDVLLLPGGQPTSRLKSKKHDVPAGFPEFWAAYPKKVGKGAAIKAWNAAVKIGNVNAIMAGLLTQKKYTFPGLEPQFIPHPSTWLNHRRWEDEVSVGATHGVPVTTYTPPAPRTGERGSVKKAAEKLEGGNVVQ